MPTKKFPFLAFSSLSLIIAIVFICINYYAKQTIEQCKNQTGVYRYENFSKSSDPIKNEYTAKNNYFVCLSQNNFIYRYKLSRIENTCTQKAIVESREKSDNLVSITAEDWYMFDNSSLYEGFTTNKNKIKIECLKMNPLLKKLLK